MLGPPTKTIIRFAQSNYLGIQDFILSFFILLVGNVIEFLANALLLSNIDSNMTGKAIQPRSTGTKIVCCTVVAQVDQKSLVEAPPNPMAIFNEYR